MENKANHEARGYLGVMITVALATIFGVMTLHRGLSAHQQRVDEKKVELWITHPTPKTITHTDSQLTVRYITSASVMNEKSIATLTTLIDSESGQALLSKDEKAWFDAFWRDSGRWRSPSGALWGAAPPKIDLEGRTSRLITKLTPKATPSLPWLSLIFGASLSLISALFICMRCRQKWQFSLFTSLSSIPLLTSISAAISAAELSSHLALEGATLIGVITALPFILLGLSQSISLGRRSSHRVAYTYMAPTLISVSLLVFIPFSIGVALSFMRHSHGQFEWVGLRHFIDILSANEYPITHPLNFYFTLAVTLFWTLANVLLHSSIGLSLALLLNREGLKLRGFYRALLIIPWAIPSYITALIWKGMFNQQYGLINHILKTIGIEPVSWMGSFWGAMAANITTNTWLGFPFMMVVTLGALQSIPTDLYEAAEIAGASRWQQFRSITLPLLKPALLPALILGSVWTFNMFNIIYLVSGGQPGGATDILITEAYRWAFEQDRYGYAAAYSLIIFFILLAYARLTQGLSKSAEEVYR